MNSLSTALTNIRRSPYQSLIAVAMMTLTFFVGYSFSLFAYGAESVLQFFETRPQAIAFFEVDAEASVITQAKSAMETKPYVTEVSVVSKEEALEIYRETNQEDPLLLELVTAEILPASIEVSGDTLESLELIRQDLEALEGIEEVAFQQDIIESLERVTNTVRYTGLGALGVLLVLSILIVMVITSLKITNKRSAIQIMRIIGASKWYVKSPFVYEGVLYGLVGSLLGWGGMYIVLLYATPTIENFLGTVPLFPLPWQIFAVQLGVGTFLGIFLGSFASSLAVQRVMRK